MTQAATKSETLHFSVDGEGLTDLLRSRVLEGRWDWSWNLLMDELGGMTAEIAKSILLGGKKLVNMPGSGDLDLADEDDAEDYLRNFDYQFKGVYVTADGRFMRAYAVVTSWGPEDMRANDIIPALGSDDVYPRRGPKADRKQSLSYRSLFYADDPDRDILRILRLPSDYVLAHNLPPHGDFSVLFKEVKGFPAILAKAAGLEDAQAALDELIASGRGLKEVGYSHTFPPEYYKIRQETEVDQEPTLERTMEALREPADVDVLLTHQKAQLVEGRIKEADELGEMLNEASRTINDPGAPMTNRLRHWSAYQRLHKEVNQEERMAGYRAAILKQAGEDVFELTIEEHNGSTKKVTVPRAPFVAWSINRTGWFNLAPKWQPVCPQGMKMLGDDPLHSDWIIGAGLHPDDWSIGDENPLSKAAHAEMYRIQAKLLNFEVPVLSGSGAVFDKIVHLKPGERSGGRGRIAVIKNAGPDYVWAAQEAIDTGGALITEAGGSVAHLVTVFRDQDLKIVRIPKASKLYPPGQWVTVDCSAGKVTLSQKDTPMRLSNGMMLSAEGRLMPPPVGYQDDDDGE